MRTPLFFEPIYQERVWGGSSLASALGRKLPDGKRIGESWEIVDRPEAQSVVARGPAKGKTLRRLIEEHSDEIAGPGFPKERAFPILVKWLDCRDRLSLQVHPPASVAGQLGGEPKTENWYIARAAEGASLLVGLKRGATREAFERAIKDGTVSELVHRFPVSEGHSILVRSGQIHAIDAGNLILEIQQNSEIRFPACMIGGGPASTGSRGRCTSKNRWRRSTGTILSRCRWRHPRVMRRSPRAMSL